MTEDCFAGATMRGVGGYGEFGCVAGFGEFAKAFELEKCALLGAPERC